MDLMKAITQEYVRDDVPAFNVGDTVKVHIKIKEGSRERIQVFEGYVLKKQGGGVGATFTVRRIASGVGVEKTFPLNSPKIEKIEVVKRGKVRRAKINYMRQRTGKSAKIRPSKRAPKPVVAAEPEEEIVVSEAEEVKVEAPETEVPATEPVDAPVEEAVAEAPVAEEAVAEEAPAEEPKEEAPEAEEK